MADVPVPWATDDDPVGNLLRLDRITAGDEEPTGNEPEDICQIVERFVALRARVADLEEALLNAASKWGKAIIERDERIATLEAANAALREEVAALVEAARPFAAVADVYDFYVCEACPDVVAFPFDEVRMDDDGPSRVMLDRADFEAVRTALARIRGEETT